jgi:hypothetical protein
VELYSLTIQLLLYPEGLTTHGINDLLEASVVEIGELRLIALKKLDIRILQYVREVEHSTRVTLCSSRESGS